MNRETAILIVLVLGVIIIVLGTTIVSGAIDFGDSGIEFLNNTEHFENPPESGITDDWL